MEVRSLWGSSPLTRSAMKGSMMSDALLLLARDDGPEASRSHTPAWNASVQEVGGTSSLWEEWRIREVRDVSVIGGSSRSGNQSDGKGKELLRVLTGKPYMNTKIPVYVKLHSKQSTKKIKKKKRPTQNNHV